MNNLKISEKINKKNILLIIALTFVILIFAILSLFVIRNANKKVDDNYNEGKEIEVKGSYNNPTIPQGFKKVETDEASWELGEDGNPKGWNDGLVIEDEIGNEFVWIPVQDIESFQVRDGYYEGESQDYVKNCKEAGYENSTIESKELYSSIKKYQGFYIARYEMGIEELKNLHIQDGSLKPLSKKHLFVWNKIKWGSAYGYALDGVQGSDTKDGAVKVARSMYPNTNYLSEYNLPRTLENNTGVVSTLCYGIQWDIITSFMESVENPYTNSKYIQDSTDMGWFAFNSHNELQLTGTDIDEAKSNCVKNIYDMAGNVYEWTMESYKDKYRIYRGGMYEMGNEKPSVSMRAHAIPDIFSGSPYVGFRVALYIKL